jgi:lipopolysaccharide biosynthesis glycosyltransferase
MLKVKDKLLNYDKIIYIDADMFVNELITSDEFFCHEKELFGVHHPGFINSIGTFEKNKDSNAYVSKDENHSIYRQGCFWGGNSKKVLELCEELNKRIDDDYKRGVVAEWHDESHLNKYLIENEEDVYTYSPEYAYPILWNIPYQKKILHLHKDNKDYPRFPGVGK